MAKKGEKKTAEKKVVDEVPENKKVADKKAAEKVPESKTAFSMRLYNGYVCRKSIEVMNVCCHEAVMLSCDDHVRIQCEKDESEARTSSVFIDHVTLAQKIGTYVFNPASGETAMLMPFKLNDMASNTGSARKNDAVAISRDTGDNRLQVLVDCGTSNSGTGYVDILTSDDLVARDPPEVPCPAHKPYMVLNVSEFCTSCTKFNAKKIRYVHIVVYPSKMVWSGMSDETTCVHSKPFHVDPKNPNMGEEEMIGEFLIRKPVVGALSKTRSIPPEKSTISVYHVKGSPLKLSYPLTTGFFDFYILPC